MLGELPITSVCWKVNWCCCLFVMFTMKVNEQNRLRVKLTQVYWGNHPLLRNGANTWRTPPYQTPLNRWTTKPAKPGVTTQRLLHGLGTQVLGHVQVASPQAPFFPKVPICSPPHLRKRLTFLYTWNIQSHGGQGQWLSWRQRGRPQPRVPQGLWHEGPTRRKGEKKIHEWFNI